MVDKPVIDPARIAELYPSIALSQSQSLQRTSQDFQRVLDQLSRLPLAAFQDDAEPMGQTQRSAALNRPIAPLPTFDNPYIG